MAAGSNFCRLEAFDVLSKTLQNLRFGSDESKKYDCDRSFLDTVDASEKQTVGTTEKPSFVMMDLDLLERKIKKLVYKLKKSNIHLEVFDADDIEYGATLGKGGEGIVQCCMVKYNGLCIKAAVKTVLNNSDDSLSLTFDEIELLCLARDPIVTTTIQVYGVAAVPDDTDPEMGHLVIITEAGLMNSLQLYQNEDIPLHVTYDIWSHLAAALHCIHTKKIIHQDLKPENILVTGIFRDLDGRIEKVQVKVIDLGMARLIESGDRVYTDDILGTEGYHAPEVLSDDSYDFRADMFVLGITFCVLLLPRSSLKKSTLMAILKRIHEAKQLKFFGSGLFNYFISPLLASNDLISSDIKSLICCMLESVEKRSITLLDVSSRCHTESVQLRQQQLVVTQSENAGRSSYHQDSGIDSLEYAIISDVTKKNTRSNAGRAAKAPMQTKDEGQTPKKRTPRRSRARLASSSTGSETNSSRSLYTRTSNAKKCSSKISTASADQEEPICRRTRSAKRPHDDSSATDDVSHDDRICRGGSFKKPPAKRMLRTKS